MSITIKNIIMKNIKTIAFLVAGAMLFAACDKKNTGEGGNGEKPGTGEPAVLFISGNLSESVTMSGDASTRTLTVSLDKAMETDCTFEIAADESALGGKKMLPSGWYTLDGDKKIATGKKTTELSLTVKPQILDADAEYVLPLRLAKNGSGDFEVDPAKSLFTLTVKYNKTETPGGSDALAMFGGKSGLINEEFNQTLEDFTLEIRFQVENFGDRYTTENTVGRNRDVFYFGGNVVLRFEDPNNDNNFVVDHHSQIQFQGGGGNPNCFNPQYKEDYIFTKEKWQHIAVTHRKSDGLVTMYMNGEKVPMQENAYWFTENFTADKLDNYKFKTLAIMGGASSLQVNDCNHGFKNFDFWGSCKTLFSEARIWSVARTEEEIKANYNKSVAVDSEGLVGYWKMNRNSATESEGKTVFRDLTGNGHDLETTQPITWKEGASAFDEFTEW